MTELHAVGDSDDEPRGVNPDELSTLLDDVRNVFRRFIVLSDEQLDTLTLWTAHTYVFRDFFVTPYLAVMSPTAQSGKTNLLTILEKVCWEPSVIVHMSTAALYRLIDQTRPTMLFDEQDMAKLSKVYQGILHSGYKQGAYVMMSERGRPTRINTYCPKAFASIGRALSSTLISRAIQVHMRRKLPAEQVEDLDIETLAAATEGLAERFANFRADFIRPDVKPEMPDMLTPRERELWLPLFSIATQAGEGWSTRTWNACVAMTQEAHKEEVDDSVLLLADVRTAFGRVNRLFSEELLKRIQNLEDAQYTGPALQSKKALAMALGNFRIQPMQIRIGKESKKGYRRSDFDDAFNRYLPDTK